MQTEQYQGDVCSARHSFALDNFIRRLFQNPEKIVGPYINKGDTIIDLGCGPGFFTIDMAWMTGEKGTVIAVDLQEEMLEKVDRKIQQFGLNNRVIKHRCQQDSLGLDPSLKADFILAYYMVHETPDQESFFKEIGTLLKQDGRLLIVEPPFHVSKKAFEGMTRIAEKSGFTIVDRPRKKGGKSLLLTMI